MSGSPIADLLDTLYLRGVRFRLDGDGGGLLILTPRGLVTPDEAEQLRAGKAEAVALIRAAQPPAPVRAWPPPKCINPKCGRKGLAMLRTVRRVPSWICPGCWAQCAQVDRGGWGPEPETTGHRGPGTAEGDVAS
jgi:hypothetical protein